MRTFLLATAFLTRVRVPASDNASDVGRAVRWFPAVGAALGTAGGLVGWGLGHVSGMPPLLAALLIVALGVWVTGAIHLDGLADMADGFGGGRSREDVLRIMRDPRVGAFGAIALILLIAVKATAIATLIERGALIRFLIAAPTLSRWTIGVLGACLPYARRDGGLGEVVTQQRDPVGLGIATACALVVSALTARRGAVYLWIVTGLVSAATGRLALRRIGGVTGDVFGANVEITETAVLVAAALITDRA
jgi:cobalamin 5'-phosphate synthase/cobalamin synthase